MKIAAIENPGSRQEEPGQFLTATPAADFMASSCFPLPFPAIRRALTGADWKMPNDELSFAE